MSDNKVIRVATTQYQTGNNIQENLQKLLGYIDEAAEGGAQLVVTPEFGNHTSFYSDPEHAWEVAVDITGDYVQQVKNKAKEHGIYVVFNATRRSDKKPVCHITNFLVGPDGELIGTDDKQALMGGEAMFLTPSDHDGRIFETGLGRIGMMSCLDGVPPETVRNLALGGAQIITNALNSCALDEPHLHIPMRAAENSVWMISSGKTGAICDEAMLKPLAEQVGIPEHLIEGLGEFGIFDTDGDVVAQLPSGEPGIVFADIEIADADSKAWVDGDLFDDRRPELYGAVVKPPVINTDEPAAPFQAAVVNVETFRSQQENRNRALDMIADAADNDCQLIVLPELCSLNWDAVVANPKQALSESNVFLQQLIDQCKQYEVAVATSLITEDSNGLRHTGIVIDINGEVIAEYHQTHIRNSLKTVLKAGDELPVFETRFGRIGIMLGYDALFPEVATVLARQGADVIVHPTSWVFDWEVHMAIPERAAENRVSILSAARMGGDIPRGSFISPLSKSTPLRVRDLNPIWPMEAPFDRECYIHTTIYPERSRNKDLIGFDLQQGRRIELYDRLVS